MKTMHICFSITAHGFGHGAITCPIINQLIGRFTECRITVMSKLPASYLKERIHGDFTHIPVGHDFGMRMHSPVRVNVEESSENYLQLLKDWDKCVASEKQWLTDIIPDLLISNISPVSLAAAQSLGIRTASVAPFNWAQIYRAYCLNEQNQQSQQIYQKMKEVYSNVDHIFKPMPDVPDSDYKEINIASIAGQPEKAPPALMAANNPANKKNILFALGGFPMPVELSGLPEMDGWQWLVDQKVSVQRTDLLHIEDLSLSFLQLLATSDVIITKPGYGTYCEIAALAKHKRVRVLSLVRPDWPETPYLNAFLQERVPFLELELSDLKNDRLEKRIRTLCELPYPETLPCEDGAAQLVSHLEREIGFRVAE